MRFEPCSGSRNRRHRQAHARPRHRRCLWSTRGESLAGFLNRGGERLPFKAVLRGLLVALLALSATGAAVPAAGVPLPPIAAGVTVGGIDVGGMTSVLARAEISERSGAPISFQHEDRSWTASPTELGADAAVEDAVVAALGAEANAELPLPIGVDRRAIRRYVARLDRKYHRDPVNSELIGLRNFAPAFTKARDGRRVDRDRLVDQIAEALRTTFRGVRLPIPFEPVEPKLTSADYGRSSSSAARRTSSSSTGALPSDAPSASRPGRPSSRRRSGSGRS